MAGVVRSESSPHKSGVSTSVRISISVLVAITLGLFIFFWDSSIIQHTVPHWVGALIILPILAIFLSFSSTSLIQQLSCSQVQWLVQLKRSLLSPLPFYLMWIILYLVPSMRWPIEGLVQKVEPRIRTGLSSAFYTFWTTLYTQALMISIAQVCPR